MARGRVAESTGVQIAEGGKLSQCGLESCRVPHLFEICMSVKIYNGFRVPGCTLDKVLQDLRALRIAAQAQAREVVARAVLYRACLSWDRMRLGLPDAAAHENQGLSYLFAAALQIADEQEAARKSQHRAPDVDVSVEVVVIPTASGLLGMVFSQNPHMRRLVQQLPGYEEFGYWDNDMPPEGVGDEAWEARRSAWLDALPGWCSPGERGFVFSLVGEFERHSLDSVTVELVHTLPVPAPETRVRELFGEMYDHGRTSLPRSESMRDFFRLSSSPAWEAARSAFESSFVPVTLAELSGRIPVVSASDDSSGLGHNQACEGLS